MAQTMRRQPFSVSTKSSDYSQPQFFNQTQFNGISDQKNDISIDQSSFADANNVYIDESNILISRPPFKFYDGEAWIIDQWYFGAYGLRLHRLLYHIYDKDGEIVKEPVDNPYAYPIEELYFIFVLRCITHETAFGSYNGTQLYNQYAWQISVEDIGWDFIPKVTCAQIEDKIFVWFAGVDFIDFNTTGVRLSDGKTYPYFENAVKYLYFPIHKLVINGIESDLETKNFLTETYRRRYQYSAISNVNFESLVGRQMSVGLNGEITQSTSKHLYDITVQENQDKMIIYPHSQIGNNYYIDMTNTPRATVILRHSILMGTIEVSFDGKIFRALPSLDNILGNPLLTRDGLWVVAFTEKGLAKCKLVAQETSDFVGENDVLSWSIEPYMRNVLVDGRPGYLETIDKTFRPMGYFETIDNFAYVFSGPSIYDNIVGNLQYLYTEWLNGVNEVVWGHTVLDILNDINNTYYPLLPNDDIKIHFRYVAPTIEHRDIGAAVAIITNGLNMYDNAVITSTDSYLLFYDFTVVEENIGRKIKNGDLLLVAEYNDESYGWQNYVYRLNQSGVSLVEESSEIQSGDIILGLPYPYDIDTIADDYEDTRPYLVGDYCKYQGGFYQALGDVQGIAPSMGITDEYWSVLKDPRRPLTDNMSTMPLIYTSDNQYSAIVDWEFLFLCGISGVRYSIQSLDKTDTTISPADKVRVMSFDKDVVYTSDDLEGIFGPLTVYTRDGTGSIATDKGWKDFYPNGLVVSKPVRSVSYTGNALVSALNDSAVGNFRFAQSLLLYHTVTDEIFDTSHTYTLSHFTESTKQMDVNILAPVIESGGISYSIIIAAAMQDSLSNKSFDVIRVRKYFTGGSSTDSLMRLTEDGSRWFKIMSNTFNVLTDKYLLIDNEVITLPQNGELSPVIDDVSRNVSNNDNLQLIINDNNSTITYDGNIHKLTDDGLALTSGTIKSGSLVSYVHYAETEEDYLTPGTYSYNFGAPTGVNNRRFYIEALGTDEHGNLTSIPNINLKIGQLIRLRAYDREMLLPADYVGNPFDVSMRVIPWEYPAAPTDWTVGDAWPSSFPVYKPIYANIDGTVRFWQQGDDLPIGPISLYGVINLSKRIKPLNIDDTSVWYNIDGTLWTSYIDEDTILEIDEYVNADMETNIIDVNNTVPDNHAIMNEHYFSFTDEKGNHLLQVTSVRRDEDKLFTDDGTDLLLYLPKLNEQKFSNEITALHPLSNTEMGIFTETDIWYVSTLSNDGSVVYTKPIKSKVPAGCRKNDSVVTALDGQAIIFPTSRGITALAPQDFIATTEKTLTYMSDAIQEKYNNFYHSEVITSLFSADGSDTSCRAQIGITTYRYWLLFYRYLDREILVFDTRNSTWWLWTTPYPIHSMTTGSHLHILMVLDFTPMNETGMSFPPNPMSLLGVSFIFTDKEIQMVTDEDGVFPVLNDTPIANIGYYDDTVNRVLNGTSESVYENDAIGYRRILHYASPKILWHITSRRLHFNHINNYKAIKGIILNLKGTEPLSATLSTKTFCELSHREHNEVIEIAVNDIRTFVKRLNIMHAIDFQYKIENDSKIDAQYQLKLDSLGIKYEVKERIR